MIKSTFMHVLTISNVNTDLQWVKDPLTATGFQVTVINAFSIKDAMVLLKSVRFDLVLYDLSFSFKAISENLQQLTCANTGIPLIVLADTAGDAVAKEALKYGAIDYIVKDRIKIGSMADSFKSIFLKEQFSYN